MEVRRIGIDQFGLASVPNGTPLSLLEAKFLPLTFITAISFRPR
jgi:hypothetical protein